MSGVGEGFAATEDFAPAIGRGIRMAIPILRHLLRALPKIAHDWSRGEAVLGRTLAGGVDVGAIIRHLPRSTGRHTVVGLQKKQPKTRGGYATSGFYKKRRHYHRYTRRYNRVFHRPRYRC